MTKEEHLRDLESKPKLVEGRGGSDAWFHFDALYEEESEEESGGTFLDLLRWVGVR